MTRTIVPSGARRQEPARRVLEQRLRLSRGDASGVRHTEGPDRLDRLAGRAEVRAVAGRVEDARASTAGSCAVDVLADGDGRDGVVAALQHERGHAHAARGRRGCRRGTSRGRSCAAISGSVRQKLFVSSSPSSGRSALPMITGRHGARPAEEVAVERLQQPVDVLGGEAADVALVVDVARRRADEHERANRSGSLERRRARRSSR